MGVMKAKKSKKWYGFCIFFLLGMCSVLCFFLINLFRCKSADNGLVANKNSYFVPIKISSFSSAKIPCLSFVFDNRVVNVKVDLGYEGELCLPSKVIKNFDDKKFIKQSLSYGLGGKTYKSDVYEVEKVYIGDMSFFPVKVEEINPEFEHDIDLGKKEKPLESDFGRIGWCLFYNFNLLVDCDHSILALCDNLETLKEHGYPVDSFAETALLLDRGFIEFEAMTEAGVLRCLLDTGSTWNMINKDFENLSNNHMIFTPENTDQYLVLNPENKSLMDFDFKNVCDKSVFKIGDKDFGPIKFNRIKSPLAIDAIIGMEFFESTVVFIDFFKRKIYFFETP